MENVCPRTWILNIQCHHYCTKGFFINIYNQNHNPFFFTNWKYHINIVSVFTNLIDCVLWVLNIYKSNILKTKYWRIFILWACVWTQYITGAVWRWSEWLPKHSEVYCERVWTLFWRCTRMWFVRNMFFSTASLKLWHGVEKFEQFQLLILLVSSACTERPSTSCLIMWTS